MSMLSSQCERLRDRADELRMLASGMAAPYIVPETKETMALAMLSAASEMHEAADTITILSDKLQGVMGTRYCELFGTPERAARIVVDMCNLTDMCPGCPFFNTPDGVCGDYYALLGWLSGDA